LAKMHAMTGNYLRYWTAHEAASECQKALGVQGIDVRVTIDADEVLDSVEKVGKPYLTPMLDPRRNDFTEANYFWLMAYKGADPIMVGGGRLDDLGLRSPQIIASGIDRAYGQGTVATANPEIASGLNGRVCYLGDLYSRSAKGLSRKNVKYFLGIANYISAAHFKADCTYSFMRSADVKRGSADTNGFDRRIYQPIEWANLPAARCRSEIIVFRAASSDVAYFNEIRKELAQRERELNSARGDLQQGAPA
jgi:hypothetical protein